MKKVSSKCTWSEFANGLLGISHLLHLLLCTVELRLILFLLTRRLLWFNGLLIERSNRIVHLIRFCTSSNLSLSGEQGVSGDERTQIIVRRSRRVLLGKIGDTQGLGKHRGLLLTNRRQIITILIIVIIRVEIISRRSLLQLRLSEVRVLQRLRCADSFRRLFLEHLSQEILRLHGQILIFSLFQIDFAHLILLQNFIELLSWENCLTSQSKSITIK